MSDENIKKKNHKHKYTRIFQTSESIAKYCSFRDSKKRVTEGPSYDSKRDNFRRGIFKSAKEQLDYLNNDIDKNNARYSSMWMDQIRLNNKCPFCGGYKDEYINGYVKSEKHRPADFPSCIICNPEQDSTSAYRCNPCNLAFSDAFRYCGRTECLHFFYKGEIWRICNEKLQIIDRTLPVYKLMIPCPECLSDTVKNGSPGRQGKEKDYGAKRICKKCGKSFQFESLYKRELQKERIRRLFVSLHTCNDIERLDRRTVLDKRDRATRKTANKWISDWLKELPEIREPEYDELFLNE